MMPHTMNQAMAAISGIESQGVRKIKRYKVILINRHSDATHIMNDAAAARSMQAGRRRIFSIRRVSRMANYTNSF